MKALNYKAFTKVVATRERTCSHTMWTETKSFDMKSPISDVLEWAQFGDGNLTITIDESSSKL